MGSVNRNIFISYNLFLHITAHSSHLHAGFQLADFTTNFSSLFGPSHRINTLINQKGNMFSDLESTLSSERPW